MWVSRPEVSETIQSSALISRRTGPRTCASVGFQYRTSIFNTSERTLHHPARDHGLTPSGKPRIEYADLKAPGFRMPPHWLTREAVRRIRATKAMLITPGDEDCRSAGSFFKNPVLTPHQYAELTLRAKVKGLQVPSYPALDAQRKVSAAWLVEHSGFSKGYNTGRAGISRKHALAIVNRGDATAADILGLKDHIQQRVEELWHIQLDPEPVFVGF
jgi:UDP-N-acetylmuramate dehydrogenase